MLGSVKEAWLKQGKTEAAQDLQEVIDKHGDHPFLDQIRPGEAPQLPRVEPILYAIDIPTVSAEVHAKVVEAVKKTGYTFTAPIRPISMKDLIDKDSRNRLGYVNDSKIMRATIPPEMEIAINPQKVRIERSNDLSLDQQKEKIKQAEAQWMKGLPEDIRPFVSMRMVDPSTLSQLEDVYIDDTGKLLFPDFFARTDVETVPGEVASVGHDAPASRRDVTSWVHYAGNASIFAMPVVVLPRVSAS